MDLIAQCIPFIWILESCFLCFSSVWQLSRCRCFFLWSVDSELEVCDLSEIWAFSWIIFKYCTQNSKLNVLSKFSFESLWRDRVLHRFKDCILWHCRALLFYAGDTIGSILRYIMRTQCSMMLKFQVRNNVSLRVNSFFLSHRFPVISFFFFFPQTCIKEKSISLCNIFFFYSRLHNLTTGLTFKCIWDTDL